MERSPIFDVTGKFIQFLMMLVTDPGDAETDNNVLTNERPVSRSRDHSLTNQSRVWGPGDAEIDNNVGKYFDFLEAVSFTCFGAHCKKVHQC